MNRSVLLLLSLCSGILSGLAWTDWCPGIILLVSFAPLFVIEDYLYKAKNRYSPGSFFIYSLPGLVVFCIITLGWIRAVSLTAAIMIVLIGGTLMAFTLWLGHMVRIKSGSVQGFLSLIVFWLTLEFICLKSEILSPWAILGNGLAKDVSFIQWYEVTGTAGGSLWILLSNLFLSRLLTGSIKNKRKLNTNLALWLAIVILPALVSLIRYNTIKPSLKNEYEAVIVQPDFDPFTEKFTIPFDLQLSKALKMARTVVSENTGWIVAPETLVDDPVNENQVEDNRYIKMIREFLEIHPGAAFITGAASFLPGRQEAGSPEENGNFTNYSGTYFNSAFKIDTGPVIEIYHKSKLVPGFEFIPAGKVLRKITRLFPLIGLRSREYSKQPFRSCFSNSAKSLQVAPVICYESVYGEFVSEYIRKGAGAIFIITNDGWWKNTNGYKQHLTYSSLRAIETRRPVVRAANTGISCFIDLRGRIVQKSGWWVPAVLKGSFYSEDRITPYVRYGDFIFRSAGLMSIVIFFAVFVITPVRKRLK